MRVKIVYARENSCQLAETGKPMKPKPSKNPSEDVIDQNLRRVFDETLEEGIPDRFKDLLAQLKQQEKPTDGK